MKRLKVLFITSWYPTKEQPLRGVFIREHAKAVRVYNDVIVLHCLGADPKIKSFWRMEQETDEGLTEGIATYRVKHRLLPIFKASYFNYFLSVFKTVRYLVSRGFYMDIIHCHIYETGVLAILIGKIYNIPVVISEHYSAFPRNMLSRKEILKSRFAFRWADIVLPVSNALKNGIAQNLTHVRFQVVRNVVDTTLFFPPSHLKEKNDHKRILFVGLLRPIKGVPFLLQALFKLRQKRDDWHLDIIGGGPFRSQYECLTTELGLTNKVSFHGSKPKSEVAEYMRKSDIFILPSLWENSPCVLIEAMACGLPIVSTKTGGIPEIIDEEIGTLVPPENATELSNAIDRMMTNLNRFDRLKIRRKALQYSQDSIGRLIHSIYMKRVNR